MNATASTPVPMAVQLRRQRGFRLPPNTIIVSRCRGTPWGNPYQGDKRNGINRPYLVQCFRELMARPEKVDLRVRARQELAGCHLACWCPLCEEHQHGRPYNVRCAACDQAGPCHRDVWLEIANGPPEAPPPPPAGVTQTILYYRHGPQGRTHGAMLVRVERGELVGVETGVPLVADGAVSLDGRLCCLVRCGAQRLIVLSGEWERARQTPEVRGFPE